MFGRWTTLLVTFVLVLSPLVAQSQEATPSEEAAIQAYREGSFSRAVQLYTKALSETDDPNHRARLQVQIGWTLFALGREGEVETHLRAALVEDPNLTLGDYYTQEFLELFEQARQRTYLASVDSGTPLPDLEATIETVNQRIESRSDLEGALADVDRLLEAYPRDGRLIPMKIQLLELLGRTEEAGNLSLSRGATAGGPSYTDSMSVPDLILRANRLLDQGDAATSLELLRQAVGRQPSNVAALELMAEAAQRGAHWQEAEFALKSALALQPDNIGLRLRLGEIYLATGESSAARDVYQELTERFPHSDRAWASLGLLEASLGNRERALVALANAVYENPLLPEVQLANGELLLVEGRIDDALQSLEAAGNLLQNDAQLEARLGQALLAKGRNEQALAHLRVAVEGGFEPPDVQRSLALALATNELFSESERVLESGDPDAGGDSEIVRGLLELERGRYSDAEAILKPLAQSRAGDPNTLNLLAATVYPQARYEEAVALLAHANELDPTLTVVAGNLGLAVAAKAAEDLGDNARTVRTIPK
jgi:tetratricopeptide (TPR) repeat protein